MLVPDLDVNESSLPMIFGMGLHHLRQFFVIFSVLLGCIRAKTGNNDLGSACFVSTLSAIRVRIVARM
jgi:hypothetical protein